MADLPTLSPARVRAAWWERQHLEQRDLKSPVGVLKRGWMYSGKVCAPHLSCFARMPKVTRDDVDGLARDGLLRDVSTVRGCGMVVPADDAALALFMARGVFAKRLAQLERKVGWKTSGLPAVKDAVLEALSGGPLTPQQIRAAVPEEHVISFGDAGKKIGESTTIPLAVLGLQCDGLVRRVTSDGRVDGLRYVYERLDTNPFDAADLPDEDVDVHALVAARYFAWAAPATQREFAWWSGLNQGQAKAAIARTGLVQVTVDGWKDPGFVPEADVERLSKKAGTPSAVRFLPLRDNYLYFRRDATAFVDEGAADVRLFGMGMNPKPVALEKVGSVANQTIFEGGRLIGVWEWDPDERTVHTKYFGQAPAGKRKAACEQEQAALTTFLVDGLGNPATWPMDSAKSRAKRLATMAEL